MARNDKCSLENGLLVQTEAKDGLCVHIHTGTCTHMHLYGSGILSLCHCRDLFVNKQEEPPCTQPCSTFSSTVFVAFGVELLRQILQNSQTSITRYNFSNYTVKESINSIKNLRVRKVEMAILFIKHISFQESSMYFMSDKITCNR